jgi:hypothetical protein
MASLRMASPWEALWEASQTVLCPFIIYIHAYCYYIYSFEYSLRQVAELIRKKYLINDLSYSSLSRVFKYIDNYLFKKYDFNSTELKELEILQKDINIKFVDKKIVTKKIYRYPYTNTLFEKLNLPFGRKVTIELFLHEWLEKFFYPYVYKCNSPP